MNILLDIEANGFNPTQIFCIVCLDVDTGEVKTFDVENIEEGVQFIQSSTTVSYTHLTLPTKRIV